MQHDEPSGAAGEGAAVATPNCPKCGGEMWDNRESKRNPKAPDFKCKDRGCDGVIWPPRTANAGAAAPGTGGAVAAGAPSCPICGGPMWDDRASKRNPKAPDFKCKNKPRFQGGPGCEGVIWPPRDGKPSPYGQPPAPRPRSSAPPAPPASSYDAPFSSPPPSFDAPPHDDVDAPPFDDDDLPF